MKPEEKQAEIKSYYSQELLDGVKPMDAETAEFLWNMMNGIGEQRMKVVIDISEHYYEILKYDVEHGNDYKPIVLIANGTPLPKGHGRIGDLSELETRIGNFIDHYKNLLEETNPEALVYMNHILDGIVDTDTIIEADKESKE